MAIFEFYSDHGKLDPMTKQILLQEYYEELLDEGFSPENAKIQMEMLKFEVFEANDKE